MAKCKWKGRGIYEAPKLNNGRWTDAYVDIPHDRQSFEGEDEGGEFLRWLNKVAIPAAMKWATRNHIPSNSRDVYEIRDGKCRLRATPNASYGYMYFDASRE